MMSKKVYFDFVNIAKLILAISIVAMHCGLIPYNSLLMTHLCRLGVPFFFVASGFFLQRKCKEDNPHDTVKGYIKRLLLPYSIFSIVWIIQLLIDDMIQHTDFCVSAVSLIQYLIFYPRGALWYVWASIIGVLMLYPFIKKGKLFQALSLGIGFYIVGLFANNYYFVVADTQLQSIVDSYLRIFLVSNNALFVGFLFLLIGIIIFEYYDKLTQTVGIKSGVTVALISFAMLALEDSFIRSKGIIKGDGAFYLSQLSYAPVMFYLTTLIKCPHLSKGFITTAKNLSTAIYFLHVPILWIIHRFARYVFPHIPGLARMAPFFDHANICFLCCLFLCCLIYCEAYKYPNSFICKILK